MFLHISNQIMRLHQGKESLVLRCIFVFFVALGASFTAHAQKPAAVQYSMDVATLTVSGITHAASSQDAISTDALGQLTGNNSTPFGGTKGMQPGRWLDVALAMPNSSPSRSMPGSQVPSAVMQSIPKGQKMGDSLQLAKLSLPVLRNRQINQSNFDNLRSPDSENRPIETSKAFRQDDALDNNAPQKLLLYWGCGDRVRPGQPRQLDMIASSANTNISSPAVGLKGRAVVEASPSPETGAATWPNSISHALVPKEASLVGKHALRGYNIPANMQFELKDKQDFMPAFAINVNGIKGSATTLNWSRIATAQGYFLMATAKNNREVIIWTSSELPEPGWGLMDYASNESLAQWKRDKIVLPANQTSCSIPAGIFSQTGGAMLNGIAYGEETNLKSRNASWNARIRVKSATMQPFDEFNVAQLAASPNTPHPPSTIIRTSSLDFPSSGSGTPGIEETLNRLLTQVPDAKPPKCDPCKRPGIF